MVAGRKGAQCVSFATFFMCETLILGKYVVHMLQQV